MFGAICGLLVCVLLRVLVEYLSLQFSFLTEAVTWFQWIVIAAAVFVGIMMVISIIRAIVNLKFERKNGGDSL